MTSRGTPSRFLRSVLHNGLGRYLCQLKRLSLVFSHRGPGSRAVREYIEEEVVDFAKQNPSIVVYVTPLKDGTPKVVAEYLNGAVREEPLNKKSVEEIKQLVRKLSSQSGLDVIRIRKPFHTDNPSIQGQWHPFINKPSTLNIQDFRTRDWRVARDGNPPKPSVLLTQSHLCFNNKL
ncbi:39S ribosomal protein L43, mitochondrial [Callorhinchus milii]|uniref:39S ribosomal protein L43, mitochondrial n=1 Tax=Callorhinchus milii TaxID=7868 RepID=UPI00045729AD|nr:39S ribosomal protein L43, mitochondrial [Callorhinchus milii]|eukprot:gi/632986781/ref/XP_007910428.1/ PREDICTED: 39S ribosomal protein L43, mitochondrial [Callorhinchus milii]